MITVYNNKYPTFATADEYYRAAMEYQANPKGVAHDSQYLNYLWMKYYEMSPNVVQPIVVQSMNNQY